MNVRASFKNALRTTSHCENAILPIGHFRREAGEELTEPAEDCYQGSSLEPELGSRIEPRRASESDAGSDRGGVRGRLRMLLFGHRRHQDGAGTQDCDGPGSLGSGRPRCCSAGEPVNLICDPARNARPHACE